MHTFEFSSSQKYSTSSCLNGLDVLFFYYCSMQIRFQTYWTNGVHSGSVSFGSPAFSTGGTMSRTWAVWDETWTRSSLLTTRRCRTSFIQKMQWVTSILLHLTFAFLLVFNNFTFYKVRQQLHWQQPLCEVISFSGFRGVLVWRQVRYGASRPYPIFWETQQSGWHLSFPDRAENFRLTEGGLEDDNHQRHVSRRDHEEWWLTGSTSLQLLQGPLCIDSCP